MFLFSLLQTEGVEQYVNVGGFRHDSMGSGGLLVHHMGGGVLRPVEERPLFRPCSLFYGDLSVCPGARFPGLCPKLGGSRVRIEVPVQSEMGTLT